jgi:hypothetical protein
MSCASILKKEWNVEMERERKREGGREGRARDNLHVRDL